MKRFLFIIAILFSCLGLYAQAEDSLALDLKLPVLGKVVTSDSLLPIRNTHVISKMGHCGTISNRDGVFYILARPVDTLWVSCIGYGRRLIPVDTTLAVDTLQIVLTPDTIMLKEVTVFPFYDYNTFKQMIIEMPSKPIPREIQRLNDELADMRSGRKRDPYFNIENGGFTASPLQYIYDHYNPSVRRQNKLLRNRKMFNEILREQGRLDELLPDSMDYSVEYNFYIYDTIN